MATGKNASQHDGGKGDKKEKSRPGYPKGPEGISKTVQSPNYPRENFAGSKVKKGS